MYVYLAAMCICITHTAFITSYCKPHYIGIPYIWRIDMYVYLAAMCICIKHTAFITSYCKPHYVGVPYVS